MDAEGAQSPLEVGQRPTLNSLNSTKKFTFFQTLPWLASVLAFCGPLNFVLLVRSNAIFKSFVSDSIPKSVANNRVVGAQLGMGMLHFGDCVFVVFGLAFGIGTILYKKKNPFFCFSPFSFFRLSHLHLHKMCAIIGNNKMAKMNGQTKGFPFWAMIQQKLALFQAISIQM